MKQLNLNDSEALKILQLTDLHLMKAESDDLTFQLIKKMVDNTNPSLIVITGDLVMHEDSLELVQQFERFMTLLQVPWTFVFGNHDHEGKYSLDVLADSLSRSETCLFEKGPEEVFGVGNFEIEVVKENTNLCQLLFLDSHNTRIDIFDGKEVWSYDYIDETQIQYVQKKLSDRPKNVPSLLFFHIPLPEFNDIQHLSKNQYEGEWHESISCSKTNSHLFDKLKEFPNVLGVFVGHDHVNDYSFMKDGILLSFGRCTGHYNYTMPEFMKGSKVIEVLPNKQLKTYVLLETEQ